MQADVKLKEPPPPHGCSFQGGHAFRLILNQNIKYFLKSKKSYPFDLTQCTTKRRMHLVQYSN